MRSRTDQRYQNITQKVEEIVLSQEGETLHIKFLCRACKVSERTLRNAFRSVYGATPYHHLRERRMQGARKALLNPLSTDTTVTWVATQFGFLELGRFSVEYRSAFGESPSTTLRRSANHSKAGHIGQVGSANSGHAFA